MKKHPQKRPHENKAVVADRKAARIKARGLKLLPYPIRENLPILGSQQRLGGKMKVLTRWFTPDGSLAWHITEGSARRDKDGKAVDYLLFGLVEGQCSEMNYFWLSDLETVRGPTGVPVERDLHWRPKTLEEIAPEMFKSQEREQEG
jgi:hypothetical protein